MTPLELEILLHCYVTPAPHPREDAPAVVEAINRFRDNDIITMSDELFDGKHYYKVTKRGKALVSLLCSTPFPTQVWIDKNGRVINIERG